MPPAPVHYAQSAAAVSSSTASARAGYLSSADPPTRTNRRFSNGFHAHQHLEPLTEEPATPGVHVLTGADDDAGDLAALNDDDIQFLVQAQAGDHGEDDDDDDQHDEYGFEDDDGHPTFHHLTGGGGDSSSRGSRDDPMDVDVGRPAYHHYDHMAWPPHHHPHHHGSPTSSAGSGSRAPSHIYDDDADDDATDELERVLATFDEEHDDLLSGGLHLSPHWDPAATTTASAPPKSPAFILRSSFSAHAATRRMDDAANSPLYRHSINRGAPVASAMDTVTTLDPHLMHGDPELMQILGDMSASLPTPERNASGAASLPVAAGRALDHSVAAAARLPRQASPDTAPGPADRPMSRSASGAATHQQQQYYGTDDGELADASEVTDLAPFLAAAQDDDHDDPMDHGSEPSVVSNSPSRFTFRQPNRPAGDAVSVTSSTSRRSLRSGDLDLTTTVSLHYHQQALLDLERRWQAKEMQWHAERHQLAAQTAKREAELQARIREFETNDAKRRGQDELMSGIKANLAKERDAEVKEIRRELLRAKEHEVQEMRREMAAQRAEWDRQVLELKERARVAEDEARNAKHQVPTPALTARVNSVSTRSVETQCDPVPAPALRPRRAWPSRRPSALFLAVLPRPPGTPLDDAAPLSACIDELRRQLADDQADLARARQDLTGMDEQARQLAHANALLEQLTGETQALMARVDSLQRDNDQLQVRVREQSLSLQASPAQQQGSDDVRHREAVLLHRIRTLEQQQQMPPSPTPSVPVVDPARVAELEAAVAAADATRLADLAAMRDQFHVLHERALAQLRAPLEAAVRERVAMQAQLRHLQAELDAAKALAKDQRVKARAALEKMRDRCRGTLQQVKDEVVESKRKAQIHMEEEWKRRKQKIEEECRQRITKIQQDFQHELEFRDQQLRSAMAAVDSAATSRSVSPSTVPATTKAPWAVRTA
ncbi:hypothetical protein AMAG_08633 [Allomyces macrogynus ATCC 38327]|uniref:Uncharacterized protein n=1 Tax=Allomyces macrogynus (strain ATCC 38327) TaxID=578462 RepID=A0A0L0SLV7_ALLM3|nr:hypothetical protein AMAG_08633 [Allomyces macrogynus ATCC 38327]|eukprot:KNE63511.1 hypothetical protein AMAG_08633 [Allomyces macrogynus ATCC 38327]